MKRKYKKKTNLEKFNSKINILPETDCWIWIGSVSTNNHPTISIDYKNVSVFKFIFKEILEKEKSNKKLLQKCLELLIQ